MPLVQHIPDSYCCLEKLESSKQERGIHEELQISGPGQDHAPGTRNMKNVGSYVYDRTSDAARDLRRYHVDSTIWELVVDQISRPIRNPTVGQVGRIGQAWLQALMRVRGEQSVSIGRLSNEEHQTPSHESA